MGAHRRHWHAVIPALKRKKEKKTKKHINIKKA